MAALSVALAGPDEARAATGHVVYATGREVYLDRGEADGLKAGQVLPLRRNRRRVGTCRILRLSKRRAVCKARSARVGDVFTVRGRRRSPRPGPEGHPPPPVPRRALEALKRQPVERVPFRGGPAATRRILRLDARLSHGIYVTAGAAGWQGDQLDLLVPGAAISRGLRLSARLRVVGWPQVPETVRYRPGEQVWLLVRETALEYQPRREGLAVRLGRLAPSAPGLPVLDGAEVAYLAGRHFEAGAYLGALPDPLRIEPTFDTLAAGAYYRGDLTLGTDALVRHEGRLGLLSAALDRSRLEYEGRITMDLSGTFRAEGLARLGLVGATLVSPGLDAAAASLTWQPVPEIRAHAGWQGHARFAVDPEGRFEVPGQGQDAEASLAWEPSSTFRLAVRGLWQQTSADPRIERYGAGPSVELPQLLGGRLAVGLGYLAAVGEPASHLLTLTTRIVPAQRLSLSAGVDWQATDYGGGLWHEAGLRLLGRWNPVEAVGVEASLLARTGSGRFGMTALLSVGGRFGR